MGDDVISWSTKDVAGVNFGDSHITVARLRGGAGGAYQVTHAGWRAQDPSAPEAELAAAVKALWRDARLPTSSVVASLRSPSLVVRYFKYPAMSEAELHAALRLQAEECLQAPADDLAVDCHINSGCVLSGKAGGNEKPIEGIMAAAPLRDVKRVLDVLFMAGLDPVILDVRAVAVANLYATLAGRREESSVCVVSLSPHSADVIVLSKSGGIYPHTVFCRASTWEESPSFLCENVRDVMKYSEFKLDWDPVRRVVLTGEIPASGAFAQAVQGAIGLPVEVWNPLSRLQFATRRVKDALESSPVNAGMLAPSLGLALRRG